MRAAVEGQNAYRDYVWCPMGRAAWDGRTCRPILNNWKGDLQPLLLEAGFARRDAEYLPLAIESLGRLASRIGW